MEDPRKQEETIAEEVIKAAAKLTSRQWLVLCFRCINKAMVDYVQNDKDSATNFVRLLRQRRRITEREIGGPWNRFGDGIHNVLRYA